MTSEEFVLKIRELIVESNLARYKKLFYETKAQEAKDTQWKSFLEFFGGLNKSQQDVFFSIVKQVEIDSVSHFLGILDGSSYFDRERGEFQLFYDTQSTVINGDMQDLFLASFS